jgi:hypothetical protein
MMTVKLQIVLSAVVTSVSDRYGGLHFCSEDESGISSETFVLCVK